MGFYVRFGIGPLRYSAPLTRRVRRTPKQQEAQNAGCAVVFLLFAAYCIVALIVKAAIAHPAAALLIGCAVAGIVLLGVIGVREQRRMNAKAARFERDALAGVQSGSADSAVIMNDASSERFINQSAGREVAPPDVPPLPAKRAESDLVAVAAARVAEKWQELEQLDSRRIGTGADVESGMQRLLQDGLGITTEIFGNIDDRVISEVKAGGRRERIGRRALPHVENAMAAMEEAVVACKEKRDIHEGMDKIDAVFGPLHLASIKLDNVQEFGDRHGQPAGNEVTPPDAAPQRLPAKRAETDPVNVAEARVAEKWQQLEQLDSRRIMTGADVESEMQRVFQDGLDITTEIFGNISDRAIFEAKAGGRRARIGNRALLHVKAAMAAMEAVVASNRKCGIFEGMDKIDAVFGPLHLAYIELVDVEELGDRHARLAGSEVTPPDAPPQLLPVKRAESDPVTVAAARVAERWREWEQLDLRRIETGVDVESEMKRVCQDAFDITTEIFGNISDRVIFEVESGGRRARIANRALPHVEDAMAAMKEVVASNRKSGILEGMDKIDAVFSPLHLAYNCLAASS